MRWRYLDLPVLLSFYSPLVLPIGQTQPEAREQGSPGGDTDPRGQPLDADTLGRAENRWEGKWANGEK